MKRSSACFYGLLILATVVFSGPVKGDFLIEVRQVGSDVVINGSGTIDLTNLNSTSSSAGNPGLNALFNTGSFLSVGATGSVSYDFYSAIGAGPMGPGNGNLFSNTGTGARVGVFVDSIIVPSGASGNFNVGSTTNTYLNQTITGLGLTEGTYTWTLPNNSKVTVQVSSAAIPEPSSIFCGSLVGVLLSLGRRRKIVS